MVTKILLNKKFLLIGALIGVGCAAIVLASSPFDITFPVPELNNCANKTECKAYCDIGGATAVQKNLPKAEINKSQGNWNFRVRVFDNGARYQLVIQNNNGIGPFIINQGDGSVYTAGNPPTCRGFQVFSTDQGRKAEHLPFSGTLTDCQTGEKISFQFPEPAGGLSQSEKESRRTQCDAFAAKHNLGNAKERAGRLEAVERDGGPGGCARNSEDPNAACTIFCSQQQNMKTCVSWAKQKKQEGIAVMPDQELEEAEKVIAALDSGVELPDFCAQDMRSCKDKCVNPDSEEQALKCLRFGKAAGLGPEEDISEDDMLKMFRIMKQKGLSFKDMEKCEEEASSVCLEIGIEAGFIPPAEAEMAKAFFAAGGPQKLGCRGKDCRDFCEKEENRQKCGEVMAPIFETNPNLLPPEARAQMEEGIGRMREALAQAPPEVIECIKGRVDSDFIDQILAGGPPPFGKMMRLGSRIGDEMRICFEAGFGGFPGGPGGPGGGGIPLEIINCLGFDPQELEGPPPADLQAKIQTCIQEEFGGEGGFPGPGGFPGAPGGFPGGPGGFPGGGPFDNPQVKGCLAARGIGEDAFRRPPTPELQQTIGECVREALGEPGEGPPEGFPEGGFPPGGQEQFEQQFDEEFQRQYQEEFNRQLEGQLPPGITPEQFQQFQEQGGFPEGFPGEFPEGFSPDQFQGGFPEGGFPPEFQPPEGGYPSPDQYQEQQYQEQYQQQSQDEYRRQCESAGGIWTGDHCETPSGPQSRYNPPSLLGFFAEILGLR